MLIELHIFIFYTSGVIFTHICILISLWLFYIQSIELHTYCISPIYDEVAVLFSSGHEESMVSFILLHDSWAGKFRDNLFEVMVGIFGILFGCMGCCGKWLNKSARIAQIMIVSAITSWTFFPSTQKIKLIEMELEY